MHGQTRTTRIVATILALAALPWPTSGLAGQALILHVRDAGSGEPLQGVLITGHDGRGETAFQRLTTLAGRAAIPDVEAGSYRVQADLIGYASTTVTVTVEAGGGPTVAELTLAVRAIELEGLTAVGETECVVQPGGDGRLAAVWEEARKALEVALWTESRGVYEFRTRRYSRRVERGTGRVTHDEARNGRAFQSTPFRSRPARNLIEEGFFQGRVAQGGPTDYFGPDAAVLLSDLFLDTHCFRLVQGSGGEAELVGLAFEPKRDRRAPEIVGTLWVDPSTWHVSHVDFAYTGFPGHLQVQGAGGVVRFERLPDGTWIVPEWELRMPLFARRAAGRPAEVVQLGVVEEGASILSVREPGGPVLFTTRTGAIDGVVVDAATGEPVAGVAVTLDGADARATTTTEGEFRFTDLPIGWYGVSASAGEGLEAVTARIRVEGAEVSTVLLRVPGRLDTR